MDFVGILRGLFGIVLLVGIAFLISNNKKRVNWRLVGTGLGIQFTIAIFIMKGAELGAFFAPLGLAKRGISLHKQVFCPCSQFYWRRLSICLRSTWNWTRK